MSTCALTSEPAICLALKNLREKESLIHAAIVELEKNLKRIRFVSQEISSEEFRRMQALPLTSGINAPHHFHNHNHTEEQLLPIRPCPATPVA